MNKKHGKDIEFPTKNKKGFLEDKGRTIKRKVLNKTKDDESLEEIKEYVYDKNRVQ